MSSFLIFLLVTTTLGSLCSNNPLDPVGCINNKESTIELACSYNYYENACVPIQSNEIGCQINLNKKACIQQLHNGQISLAKCYFGTRCREVTVQQLENLGCSDRFSKFACVSVKSDNCIWQNEKCIVYNELPKLVETCELAYENQSVVPNLCAKIKILRCQSADDFKCIQVEDTQLSQLECTQLGLNLNACLVLEGKKCIFKDDHCQYYEPTINDKCYFKVNKLGCLAIKNPSQVCQWKNHVCEEITNINLNCEEYIDVNAVICSKSSLCYYSEVESKCKKITDMTKIECSTPGLSYDACMLVNQSCSFYYGYCTLLQQEDLQQFRCTMQLNKIACLNLTTYYQLCQWNIDHCQPVNVNQNDQCLSFVNVNGNVCQSILYDRCTYDQINKKCSPSSLLENCTTPFLNLIGCVQVTRITNSCMWDQGSCQNVIVIPFKSKCGQMGYANSIVCSQIQEDGKGCYFNIASNQCLEFTMDDSLGCLTPGLNRQGCALITKKGELCQWYQEHCKKIYQRAEMTQYNCLSLQYVNGPTCALIQSERCKFNSKVLSCVPSVDGKVDTCDTPGLNSIGCGAILTESCYYDNIDWTCKKVDPTNDVDGILKTSTCTGNTPTQGVCIAITTYNQSCAWQTRLEKCTNQYVGLNANCLEFNTVNLNIRFPGTIVQVNSNVCASIEMNQPQNNGYCYYDTDKNDCKLFDSVCNDDCCTNIVGINTHVCSRYSNQNKFCYFNKNQRCALLVEVDTSVSSLVHNYFNTNRYKCSQLNSKSCHIPNWSKSQWCYWDGVVCVNVNFQNYPNLQVFIETPAITNNFLCLAIEAVQSNTNLIKFFQYDDINLRCQKLTADKAIPCSYANININSCTRLTKDDYCVWNRTELACSYIDDLSLVNSCTELINEKACDELLQPCVFLYSTDKCEYVRELSINCNYFNTIGTVSARTCASIIKDGQSCKYDKNTRTCIVHNQEINSCAIGGANSLACYKYTTAKCRWNVSNLQCYEEVNFSTLGCEDNVNKIICFLITKEACEWNDDLFRCTKFTSLTTVNSKYSYNALACTQLTGNAFIHFQNQCVTPASFNLGCNDYPMNIEACLIYTRGHQCQFDNSKQLANEKCNVFVGTPSTQCSFDLKVSIDSCTNLQAACYFDQLSHECLPAPTNGKCSDLMDASKYYNIKACISVNPENTELSSTQVCIDKDTNEFCQFEKYCQWDSSLYSCKFLDFAQKVVTNTLVTTLVDVTDEFGNVSQVYQKVNKQTCKFQIIQYNTCKNTYSKAVCLELVKAPCYFDYTQGGCMKINEYQVPSCDSANEFGCQMITNPLITCTIDTAPDYVPGCSIKQNLNLCKNQSLLGVDCAQLNGQVNGSVCASATDHCYFDGTTCSNALTITICDQVGLSKTTCDSLGNDCQFINNQCYYKQVDIILQNCDEVNTLTIGSERLPKICTLVTDQPCQFLSGTCNLLNAPISCSTAQDVSLLACMACTGDSALFIDNLCKLQTDPVYFCANLNKDACLKLSTGLYCIWQDDQCQQVTTLSGLTDCSVINLDGCPQIQNHCWKNGGACQLSLASGTCQDVADNSGNILACQFSTDSCVWDNEISACISTGTTIYNCSQEGLSQSACFTNTYLDSDINQHNICYFKNSCTSNSTDMKCSESNKYGCLAIQDQLCGWDDTNLDCTDVSIVWFSNCSRYINSSNVSTVSPFVCSSIKGDYCYMKNNVCIDLDINNPSCVQPGLNENACLEKTSDNCQFVLKQCTNLTNLDQDCNVAFNKWSCINLLNRKCQFITTCKEYSVTATIQVDVMSEVGPSSAGFISPLVCETVNAANTYLIYDITTYKCRDIDVAPPTTICVATGINKLGCLSRTKQFCRYDPDLEKCQLLLKAQVNAYSTCDISLNWMSCINLPLSCKFKNDSCTPLPATDTCTILSTESSKVIATVCQKKVDKPCYYDTGTSQCNIAVSTTIPCTQLGLNQLGCIQNTQSDQCEFDVNSSVCKMNPLNNRECTYPINEKKCYEVEMDGNFCKFNLTCQQMLTTEQSVCVKVFKTNSISCSQALDQSCSYNSSSQKCIAGSPTDECLLNNSINQLGCVSCEVNNRKLKWLDGCLEATTKDLSILTCQDSVNIFTCINIDNPTQYCKFTDKCIQYPLEIYSCESIINVNRYEYCELATDLPCQFDQGNHKCKVATDPITACPRGLNQLACLQKTTPGLCSFKNFCYGPDDILLCFQAINQNDCLNITTDTCKWTNNECQTVDTTNLFCSNILEELVSNSVCQQSSVTNVLDVCVRDATFHCKVIQPTICEELTNNTACTRILGIPCVWKNSKCSFYQNNKTVDTCVSVNSIGSQRVCLDVKRQGQKCKFMNYHCLILDPVDEGCMDNYNQIACLAQTKFQCIWQIENRNVIALGLDVIYQSGKCQNYVEDPSQNCSDNLSYLVCLLVKQKGQFCKWLDNKCISINTSSKTLKTLVNVNANACSLIENYIVQYDEYFKACKIGQDERTCETAGLNKLGCLSLENQNCAFNEELKYCYEQQELSQQPINSCQIQNVSPQLCQQLHTGRACGFENGSCIDLSLNSKCGPGINFYGCMTLNQYSCIWLDGTCQEYVPYTDCSSVPNNVNQRVCSQVQEDACMWDSLNYKCISSVVGVSCDIMGLNQIGCVNIDNCLFKDNKCQLRYDKYHCADIPSGNALVCAAALDNCKYNQITYGCTESTLSEICSTPGLSQSGCDLLPQCQWQQGGCHCKQFLVRFPVCSTINSYQSCSQIDYCYFELVKVNSPKDLTEFLQISDSGVCRDKKCSDIEDLNYCSGTRIAAVLCYLSQGVCKPASSCQEIKNYQGNCQQFKFNLIPCNDNYQSCKDLNCEELSQSQCQSFNDYCYYDQQYCKPLICSKMTQNQCVNSNCDWDVDLDACKTQIPCDQVVDKLTCMSKKQNSNQCAWLGKCVLHGCRSINNYSYSQSCSGTHIGNEVCVKIIDESCVSCEEIQDPCVCLNQPQYCLYDNLSKKCLSVSCYDFEQSQCPAHCRFTNKICQPLCYSHYNVHQCNQGTDCYWDAEINLCQYDSIIIPDPEIILPELTSGLIIQSGILIILSF